MDKKRQVAKAKFFLPMLALAVLVVCGLSLGASKIDAKGGYRVVLSNTSAAVSLSPLGSEAGTGASVSTTLTVPYVPLSNGVSMPLMGLSNVYIPMQYAASVYDKGSLISPGGSVHVGDSVTFKFMPHQSTDISWFGTADTKEQKSVWVSFDSPYGSWGSNTTCSANNYVTTTTYFGTQNIYVPLDITPPATSLSLSGSQFGGAGCGTLTPTADGGTQTTCTALAPGNSSTIFNFSPTTSTFYSYSSNPTLGNCTYHASYSVSIPGQNISYNLNASPSSQPPVTPTLTCPASVRAGQPATFSVSATDPLGLQLRYGMDWLGGSSIPNAWLPTTGYVDSGTSEIVSHTWAIPGTYSVRALAQNTSGESSGWSPSCSVTVTSPPTVSPTGSLTGTGCVLPSDGGSCNISLHWTASGTHNNLVDLGLTLPDNSVITAPILGILTLTDTTGVTTHPTSFLGLPADPDLLVPAGTPGTYAFKMYDNGTTNQIGSTLPLVACPNGDTLNTSATPERCVPPAGTPLPTVTFYANPSTIDSGQSSTLYWSSANATSCSEEPGTSGFSTGAGSPTKGSTSTGVLTTTTNYSLTCTGPGGSTTGHATVTVLQPNVSITASPTRVASGGSTVVSWNATNVDTCSLSRNGQPWPAGGSTLTANKSRQVSGSHPDTITSDTTYTITCTSNASATSAATTISAAQVVSTTGGYATF